MRVHTLTGIGLLSALLAARVAAAAGTFTYAPMTGDVDSGITPTKTYTHAVDFAGPFLGMPIDTATAVNGVTFHVGGPNGPGYSSTNFEMAFAGFPSDAVPSGPNTLYDVLEDFFHNSTVVDPPNQTLTLTGLTPGTTYTTAFYNAGFDLQNVPRRLATITTSDGGSIDFDQNFTGDGGPSVLRYTFTAASPSMTYTFDPAGRNTFHHYGFTNEVVPEPAGAVLLLASVVLAGRRSRECRAARR